MKWERIGQGLIVIAGCLLLGWVGSRIGAEIVPAPEWEEAFWSRFQYMFVFAVLIERSVEVYLNASRQNGDDRFAPEHLKSGADATRVANTAAIVLGILVALAGVRLLSTLGTPEGANGLTTVIWFGSDVVLSAGLMAGGSVIFHEVAEVLRGGIGTLSSQFRTAAVPDAAAAAALRAKYTITVTRTGTDRGKLVFSSGLVSISEDCYWDPAVKIAAATYVNCSKTRMSSKKDSVTGQPRPGIYLPDAVVPGTDNHSIFIHEAKDASWSDGCIVLDRDKMMKMWDEISPSDARNVTVYVTDA